MEQRGYNEYKYHILHWFICYYIHLANFQKIFESLLSLKKKSNFALVLLQEVTMRNEKLYFHDVTFDTQTKQWKVTEPNRLFHELGIERCD